jgi:hypothetical protein
MNENDKIVLDFVELHAPLFLNDGKNGRNLGNKIATNKYTGLELIYDRQNKELLVRFEGRQSILPSSAVHSMTPRIAEPTAKQGGGVVAEIKTPSAPVKAQIGGPADVHAKAQVSTPMSHVFEGPGKGKS